MKSAKLLTTSLLISSFLFATTAHTNNVIAKKAISNGMMSIPEDKAVLQKLIDPNGNMVTAKRVELGKKLYFEPRLSKSGIISCNTCHNLGLGGADGVAAAVGHQWKANPHHLNSPTVYNAVFFQKQFWDGRSHDLEDQAQGPMQAAPEMASPQSLVIERINSIPEYVAEFKGAYGDKVNIDFEIITATIGIFERTLVTPAPFDDFLNGKEDALTDAQKVGLNTFIEKGCANCHNGIALGGTMQPFEIAAKYKFAHLGDFKGDDKGMVKTPTLRNITETAPYYHNGGIWSLAEAVKEMGSTQLGIKISDREAKQIVNFLGALKGRKPEITYPQLPESTLKTPQPDFN